MKIVFGIYGHSMERSCTRQMTLLIANLQFIISNVFTTRVYVIQKKTSLAREILFCFNFCFFMLGFSKRIDSYVSLLCFFSISAIPPVVIYFDLRLKNMFSKITISLLYYSISVIKILLQIFLLINSLSLLCN